MNNVDLFIKYLSGDMTGKDAEALKKNLASNPVLKEEYDEVSAAYQFIKAQLWKRDEDSFRAKLQEVMEKPSPKILEKSTRQWPRWYFLLPLAGSLAILLAVFMIDKGPEKVLSRFFEPLKDPVVLAYNQGTRGDSESGIMLYQAGHYQESMEKLSQLLVHDSKNQVALLFYLLASMELDLHEDAINKIQNFPINIKNPLGQSLTWYTALALVKSDRLEEAANLLQSLTEQAGPYQTDAGRMQKMLLK